MNNDIGVYIHIPFCLSKCYYCDFASFANCEALIEPYIDALCEEILKNSEILSQYNISTIYIGGGTPSYIDAKYIVQILDTLKLFISSSSLKEVTIEVNPNSITKEKLEMYKEAGVNRLSIGLQSTYDKVLKMIGRAHKLKDFEETLNLANEVGFSNISLDLIYPLPDLSLEEFKNTVDYAISLKEKNIKHISIYNLEIHENTKLAFLLKEGYISLVDEDTEYEMYKYLKDTFETNEYHRYEISNYALKGYESIHNLKYWNQEQYLGFGSSAASFFGGRRYSNLKDVREYINNIKSNKSVRSECEELDLLALMKEYVMLNLRKTEGLDKTKFKRKYQKDVYDIFSEEINELVKDGLLKDEKGHIMLTDRGLEVANLVWEKFV